MKLVRIDRKTRVEKRYTPEMGRLHTKVTYIRKKLLGVSYRTLHKYRETYYGEVKDCRECVIQR
jgi:hypothetical protein